MGDQNKHSDSGIGKEDNKSDSRKEGGSKFRIRKKISIKPRANVKKLFLFPSSRS